MSESLVGEACSLESLVGRLADEFLRRQEAGERPDVEEYVSRYPQAADLLRKVLASLRLLQASLSGEGLAPGDGGDEPAGTLGDFRLGREIGRGGMGLVYEAEQISLGRRVALKVLPFAATMDPRQLQRFHNEARAAAGLHHTNIVPVYAVGCERGVHYYAMQLIDGRTLADFIAQQCGASPSQVPTTAEAEAAAASAPTVPPAAQATSAAPRDAAYFRRMAEWGIQAAEALDYAHTLGIIHRDVKPANLMVDAAGRLWVTDFGLAQVQSDVRLTMTGDLVGTLRYMSPEQALAKRVVIDHRTDVYSLGATLYELLTLEPAVSGGDRQELLRQIAFEEPKPPRRINKAIPAELETIVLKAMEKNPADRYATAKELADDLRRFLEDKAIRAKRPTLRQRAGKWARRHQPVVWAAAAVLFLAASMLTGTLGWAFRDWSSRHDETTRVVRAALDESASWQQRGRTPEALAAARRADGLVRGGTPDEELGRQVRARLADLELLAKLEDVHQELAVLRVHDQGSGWDWGWADARYRKEFGDAGFEVETLPAEQAGERLRGTTVAAELAAALDHWSLVRRESQGADDPIRKHLLAVAREADRDNARNRVRDGLAQGDRQVLIDLAASDDASRLLPATLHVLGKALQDGGAIRQAESLMRQVQWRHPDDFWANYYLATLVASLPHPKLEEAIRYLMMAMALRPQSPIVHTNLGSALWDKGDKDGGIAELREAIRINKDFALAHYNLGVSLKDKGDLDEAIAEYREAIRLKNDYAQVHGNLAVGLRDKGNLGEAIAEYKEAIRISKDFEKKDFAKFHHDLGVVLTEKGDLDEAIAECHEAIRIKKDYSDAHNALGNALADKGNRGEAIAEYKEAIRLNKDHPLAHSNLGTLLSDNGELDGAIAEYKEAIRLNKDLAEAHNNLGNALAMKSELNGAIAEFREAIRIKSDYAVVHCNLGRALQQQGQFADALAARKRGHELGSRQSNWRYPSAQWVREAERLVELDVKLPRVLKGEVEPADVGERLALAQLCQLPCKSLYAAAVRFYADAFSERPQLADDLQGQPRYNAACAAALAGCGQGKDADQSDDKERVRLRRQALEWLRADLAAYRRLLDKEPDKAGPAVCERMQHWQQDTDFAGVRGPEALAKLPEAERPEWQKLWQEVEALRTKAAGSPKP